MATAAPPVLVHVPRLEDEIEDAFQKWITGPRDEDPLRAAFEAGFRAARTFMVKEF